MPLDTSLYNQNPLRSMADYQGQYNKLDAQNQALQQGAIALQQANPRFQAEMALKAAQAAQENSRVPLNQARTVEAESNTSAKNLDRQIKGHSFAMQKLTGVNNPADIVQWATEANAQGAFGDGIEGQRKMVQGLTAALEAAKTPEGFAQWKQQAVQSGMTVHEQLVAKQEAEKAAEAVRHNQTTEANTLTTNALTNATSRANNRDTIASHERVAEARLKNDVSSGKTQVVIDPEKGPLVVDKVTGVATPVTLGGQPIAGKNATAAIKLQDQLTTGIAMARELIPKATGSGAGALADSAAGFFGKTLSGAEAATQLETLAGWMTSNVPRMQGPQSDKDTLLYRQMSAQVGDRTKTREARLKALDTLEQLQKKYAESSGVGGGIPAGVDPKDWEHMTPQEKALWKK